MINGCERNISDGIFSCALSYYSIVEDCSLVIAEVVCYVSVLKHFIYILISYLRGKYEPMKSALTRIKEFFGVTIFNFPKRDSGRNTESSDHNLLESAQWQTTFDAVKDGICIIDNNQYILRYNKAMSDLFPGNTMNLIGKPCWAVVHGTDHQIDECPIKKMNISFCRESTELKLGDQWFDVTVDPLFGTDKKLVGAVHIIRDITEHRQAEDALQANYSLLRIAGKMARFGGWVLNLSDHVVIWSDEVAAIHEMPSGYSPSLEEGINFYAPECRERITSAIADCTEHGISFDEELELITAKGKRVWVRATGEAVRAEDDQIVEIRGAFQNINERKKTEENLVELNRQLNELNATKDKFFSIIAHDLKSPFNSIMGFSNLMERQIEEKDYRRIDEYARIIQSSSVQAMDLLMNLLEWSRAQTGRMEFQPRNLDLVPVINRVAELLKSQAAQKSITLQMQLPGHVFAFADEAMTSTILRNLISNAVKFTNPGGKVLVFIEQKADELMIVVSDNGVGIKPEAVKRLFRIDENHSTLGTQNEKGTGLGLILCKEFVEKHSGRIWVESIAGKGSQFYFTIPIK